MAVGKHIRIWLHKLYLALDIACYRGFGTDRLVDI
jgi:hypothetical protein